MTLIISTPAVRDKFGELLPKAFAVDLWLVRKVVPCTAEEIAAMAVRNGMTQGTIILLVRYGRRHPEMFPPMCYKSWFISLVFYTGFEDIFNWLNAVRSFRDKLPQKALVLGMMKPFYVHWAQKIYQSLKKERYPGTQTVKLLPDNTSQSGLARKLSKGCSLAVYAGHGRSRGWSGYRGFRWKHVALFEQADPLGTMVSLSCSSLKMDKQNSLPMGLQWVMSGRCCAFVGTFDSVKIKPLTVITSLLLEGLQERKIERVNEWLLFAHQRIMQLNEPEVIHTWSTFRMIGYPFLPLQAESSRRPSGKPTG